MVFARLSDLFLNQNLKRKMYKLMDSPNGQSIYSKKALNKGYKEYVCTTLLSALIW